MEEFKAEVNKWTDKDQTVTETRTIEANDKHEAVSQLHEILGIHSVLIRLYNEEDVVWERGKGFQV